MDHKEDQKAKVNQSKQGHYVANITWQEGGDVALFNLLLKYMDNCQMSKYALCTLNMLILINLIHDLHVDLIIIIIDIYWIQNT